MESFLEKEPSLMGYTFFEKLEQKSNENDFFALPLGASREFDALA